MAEKPISASTCYEITTTYKSGRARVEIIVAVDEKDLWKTYDKHHNRDKIQDIVIINSWSLTNFLRKAI